MNAETTVRHLTDTDDQSNLCVIFRPGERGLEVCLVADEKGRWSIPGGHAKGNETHAQAAQREVKEETGLDAEPQPMFLAQHVARKLPVHLFYATVDPDAEGRPGGGDVTKVLWARLHELGSLNGTDRLAIHVAANKIYSRQDVIAEAAEKAEQLGYAVATVVAGLPAVIPGAYLKLSGKAALETAQKIADSLGPRIALVSTEPYASTQEALCRANRTRRLTPVLEALICAAEAIWQYESRVAPLLAENKVVIATGPDVYTPLLLQRGLEEDLWFDLKFRIPQPLVLEAGSTFNPIVLEQVKDLIESITEDRDDAY